MTRDLRLINARLMGRRRKTRLATIEISRGNIRRVIAQKSMKKAQPDVIDACGNLVLPGFIDSHCHMFGLADYEKEVKLAGCRSIQELQSQIVAYQENSSSHSSSMWLFGRGWDQDLLREKRMPNKNDLDELKISKPIVMVRVCGHIAVMNSLALKWFEKAGCLKDPTRKTVERDSIGNLTGIVKEAALSRCWNALKKTDLAELKGDFLFSQSKALSYGITAIHCILSENWRNELRALKQLDRDNRLSVKTSLFLPVDALDFVSSMSAVSRSSLLNGHRVKVIGFKLFADGSLGARTAALRMPYDDDEGNTGILNYENRVIVDAAKAIKKLHMILAVHAIGDRAVEQVLDCFRTAGITRKDHFRIEHVSVITPQILSKIGVPVLCVQPMFASSDYRIRNRIGSGHERVAYSFRTLSKKSRLIAGSDSPVETLDPLKSIKAACSNAVDPDESMQVSEALRMYTSNASQESPLTRNAGRISRGRSCDIVILNRQSPEEITDSTVTRVFVDGKPRFTADC